MEIAVLQLYAVLDMTPCCHYICVTFEVLQTHPGWRHFWARDPSYCGSNPVTILPIVSDVTNASASTLLPPAAAAAVE
jgi:hypothetical protein